MDKRIKYSIINIILYRDDILKDAFGNLNKTVAEIPDECEVGVVDNNADQVDCSVSLKAFP